METRKRGEGRRKGEPLDPVGAIETASPIFTVLGVVFGLMALGLLPYLGRLPGVLAVDEVSVGLAVLLVLIGTVGARWAVRWIRRGRGQGGAG